MAMDIEIRDIIDSYADSLDYFAMLQELKQYKLLEQFEENREYWDEYIESTWY